MKLFALVLAVLFKGHQIEHLPNETPNPLVITFLQLLGIEVGGAMGLDLPVDKKLIARYQDLPHHIAILSIMPSRGFHAKVIKTKVMPVAVILNDLETNVVEPEHNISAGNDGIGFLVGLQEFQ